jgi:predicted nucleic acid-binding protein
MPAPDFSPGFALSFLDTNVLVYAYDHATPAKQRVARDLVRRALSGGIVISMQVLAEFAATMLYKASPPAAPSQVLAILDALAPIPTVAPDAEIVRRAVEASKQFGVHFWDGMILASAERAGCSRIWSEDFNTGQSYFGVRAENPFRP